MVQHVIKGYGFIHFTSVNSCVYALQNLSTVECNGVFYSLEMSKNLQKQLCHYQYDEHSITRLPTSSMSDTSSLIHESLSNDLGSLGEGPHISLPASPVEDGPVSHPPGFVIRDTEQHSGNALRNLSMLSKQTSGGGGLNSFGEYTVPIPKMGIHDPMLGFPEPDSSSTTASSYDSMSGMNHMMTMDSLMDANIFKFPQSHATGVTQLYGANHAAMVRGNMAQTKHLQGGHTSSTAPRGVYKALGRSGQPPMLSKTTPSPDGVGFYGTPPTGYQYQQAMFGGGPHHGHSRSISSMSHYKTRGGAKQGYEAYGLEGNTHFPHYSANDYYSRSAALDAGHNMLSSNHNNGGMRNMHYTAAGGPAGPLDASWSDMGSHHASLFK